MGLVRSFIRPAYGFNVIYTGELLVEGQIGVPRARRTRTEVDPLGTVPHVGPAHA